MEVFSLISLKTYDKILSFKYNFYKELYDDGIRQRSQINTKFIPTITILSAEIGGILWIIFKLLNSIEANNNFICVSNLFVFLFFGLTIVSIGISIVYFILCFTNYNFEYPEPYKVKKLVNDNISRLDEYSEDEILDNIITGITNDYMEIAINNDEETNKHSKWLNRCYIGIIVTLIFMIFAFILVLL